MLNSGDWVSSGWAGGVIVAVGRISPAEAWDVLRETSMCTNIKMRLVAEMIVTWARTGDLAAELRGELAKARLSYPRLKQFLDSVAVVPSPIPAEAATGPNAPVLHKQPQDQ